MKCALLRSLFVLSLLASGPVFGADVVINEIMYLPSSKLTSEEFIEIHNRGPMSVNLQGWRFSKGISFTFTNSTPLAAGQFLVVAADRAALQAKYPSVANIVGNWQGTLSNRGEEIELEDALGNVVDSVHYADEGDWAIRRRGPLMGPHRGWVWTAAHDGLGSSAERINGQLTGENGQNWAPSLVPQGTPGAANSVANTDIAPMILDVEHIPAVPSSADTVTVVCRLVDEFPPGVSVTLWYRPGTTPFIPISMVDDGSVGDGLQGDGIFGAILPVQPNGTVVEFYVEATDGDSGRTWPAPALDENGVPVQAANMLYQVDDSVIVGTQPVYRFVLTESERLELASSTIRQTDAQMNTTFISTDGVETKVRYNVGIRIRGAGSRGTGNPVPNYRVNIPSDRLWNGLEAINVNSRYPHSQLVGSVIANSAGLPASQVRAAQVRVNGQNLAQTGSPQYGFYASVEVYNADWTENHFPNDSEGNVYRGSTGNHSATMNFLGTTNPVSYMNAGYLKASNQSENDWRDLIRLTFILSTNSDDSTYVQDVTQVANVELWMRYFAVFSLLASYETSLATGRGDDWVAYRGVVDSRFVLLPHDMDSILGDGGGNVNDNIFRMCPAVNGGANTVVLNRFMRHPEFVRVYFRELKRLIDTSFSPSELNLILDQTLKTVVSEQVINNMKQFAVNRNQAVLNQIPLTYSVNVPLGQVGGYFQTGSPTVNLDGRANAIETKTIRVNGNLASYTPWQGTWNLPSLSLTPGLNRVIIQFLGDLDQEVQRLAVDIWYDDASVVNVAGTISTDTTWTAGGGPYRLSGNVTVPVGVTLTIEPGATLFFGASARLTVQGRLLAQGTELARIRMTRQPGTADLWSGLLFSGTTQDNRLTYADLEFAANADAISLVNSSLLVDQVTWSGTTRTIIDLSNSSILVRNSTFPTIVDNETIHGVGMPPNGYVIIESNYFGGTTGYSDIIDFTGGQRPGPILQVYHNLFNGGSDDALDLDGTDAHIEGNVFMNIHQDSARDSGSYAIATDTGADITVVRNFFYNNDHALLLKNDARAVFHNNTVYHIRTNNPASYPAAVISFGEPDRDVGGGAGADLDGNIFWDIDQARHFLFFTNEVMFLNVQHSILAATNHPGTGNQSGDPRFVSPATNTITALSIRQALALQAGSPGKQTGPNGLDMGAAVPGGASISGEPLSPTSWTSATLTVGGPGMVAYRASLNGGAFGDETPVATALELTGLAGSNYVRVIGKNSAGLWQDAAQATVSRGWVVVPGLVRIVLNEVLARNVSAVLHEDTFPDLVELYNAGGMPVELGGMGLTDATNAPYRFTFPVGTQLMPGEYLVVYADDDASTSGLHLGFGLDQDGDDLFLFNRLADGGQRLDSVSFGPQVRDLSIGRDAHGRWGLCSPTFGAANLPHASGDPFALRLNEWGAVGQSVFQDDFVELYNPQDVPVGLGGLFLTDRILGDPARHRIAELSFIASRGHLVFLADDNEDVGALHLPFQLSSEQGELGLLDPSLKVIDAIIYGPQLTDVSQGRRPSGSEEISYFGSFTQSQPTPGAPNPGTGSTSTTTNIVVNLLPLAADWRYDSSGVTDWTGLFQQPDFDDSFWPVGPGLLGVENAFLPAPGLQTFFPNYNNFQPTYYFRTQFEVTTNLDGFNIGLQVVLDDGAVVYLNGSELLRIRMPGGPISFNSQANSTVSDASLEFLSVAGVTLPQGTNILAVEVHQAGLPSSDVVWGLALSAVKTITNYDALVVLNEFMANNLSVTNFGQTNITDWVELFNPSDRDADLSGFSLSDDDNDPTRWVFPAGVIVPAGGYLVIRCDGDAPPSTNALGPLNTGFGLGAGGDKLFLFDRQDREGRSLDSISFGLQAADFSLGRIPNAFGAWRLNLPTPGSVNLLAAVGSTANLKINEWMANPSGGGNDYIEIYNPNPQPVDLSGLFLTDDLTDRDKHEISEFSFVGAGVNGYAVFIADEDTQDGPDHLNFRLSGGGEAIGLYRPNLSPIDTVTFGSQDNGVSEGKFPDGSGSTARFPGSPTPGASNLRLLTSVAVSEVLSHTDSPFEDAIEVQNLTQGYLDISGWYLSDRNDDVQRFVIPAGTVLSPGGHVVFYEYQFNPDFGVPPSFSLSSARGDQVYLAAADTAGNLTGFRAVARFGPIERSVSFGRYETSVGADFVAMTQRTFGQDAPANLDQFRLGTGLSNAAPRIGPIVISEIQYHATNIVGSTDAEEGDFVELHNPTGSDVMLFDPLYPTNRWRLRDSVDYDFPAAVTMASGGYLLVVSFDPTTNAAALARFRSFYGVNPNVPIYGPYRGALDNGADTLELERPDEPEAPGTPDAGLVPYVIVERVRYSDTRPWPTAADGVGLSLQRRGALQYGNDPVNWQAGAPTAGGATGPAAGSVPVVQTQPVARTVSAGGSAVFNVLAVGTPPLRYQWRKDGQDVLGATNNFLGINNAQYTNGGQYRVLVQNAFGAVLSDVAVLDVLSPPSITKDPVSQLAAAGSTVVFSAAASGSRPLTFRWRKDGELLPGQMDPVLRLFDVQTEDEGRYDVVAANSLGSATSRVAVLTINQPPVIQTPPLSQDVYVGATVTFTVVATGTPPLRYIWQVNGAVLLGETNQSLVLNNVDLGDAGAYSVTVLNGVGSAPSPDAILTVRIPPTLSIVATDGQAAEPADGGEFLLRRSGATNVDVQVLLSAGGNAIAGSDYVALPASVLIPAGATSAPIALTLINDSEPEGDETVTLTVQSAAGYVLGTPVSASATIKDDDNRPPVVSITSPQSNTLVTLPATVLIQVTAADPDGPVARVEFFADQTNKLGEVTAGDFTFSWVNPPAGSHLLTAVAWDTLGASGISAPVPILVNRPPLVAITTPTPGSFFLTPADIPIGAAASDPDGSITQVDFYEGGNLIGSSTQPVVPGAQADYLFQDTRASAVGSPPGLADLGNNSFATATVDGSSRRVLSFAADNGLSLNGASALMPGNVYSIVILFSFEDVSSWRRLIDFKNGSSDNGLYVYNGQLNLWPVALAPGASVSANTYVQVALTRSAAGVVAGYVNGVEQFTFTDANNDATLDASDVVRLFRDNGNGESSAGSIARLRIFNRVLSALEVAGLDRLPGTGTSGVYNFTWNNVTNGSYSLTARATDDRGAVVASAVVPVTVGMQLPTFADMFQARGLILGFTNFLRGTNIAFTKEPGEPMHGGLAGDHTAWVSWIAPGSGPCTMDTWGSDFDTVLAVYTGDNVNALTPVASNDDDPLSGSLQSRVTFNTVAGTLYQVAVTGYGQTDFGVISFHLSMPNPLPIITQHPQSQTVNQGGAVTFSVVATGASPLTYQWRFNGASLAGQTAASLVLNNVQGTSSGDYTVEVFSPGGSVVSSPATLTVRVPAQIVVHPQGQIVNAGDAVTLTVVASGSAPLTYVWRFNGGVVAGATNSSLSFGSVAYTNGGLYLVTVMNSLGSAISQLAEIAVRPRVVGAQMLSNSQFRLTYEGTPGRRYAVEGSSNSTQWSTVGNATNTSVSASFHDTGTPGERRKLYRLRLLP